MLNNILGTVIGIGLVGYALFSPHPTNQPIIGIYNGVNAAPGSIGTNTYHPMFNQNNRNNPNGSSIIGNVSSINGSTLTIEMMQRTSPTAASTTNVTFTVDASSARVIKQGATTTASLQDIKIGDRVIAQGTIKGNSMVAKLVIDTLPPKTNTISLPIKTSTSATSTKSISTKSTKKK